jgi:hypothetical protein
MREVHLSSGFLTNVGPKWECLYSRLSTLPEINLAIIHHLSFQSIIPTMIPRPVFRSYLISTLALILIGWGGIAALFYFSLPYVWARWGFFVLAIMALTGTALPVIYFFHRRFPADPPVASNVIVRQALWAGVYVATIAWLQLGRLVSLFVILGLAGGLIAIEYFIRLREKATRTPPVITDDDSS